ncbi:IS701 family transposase [Streptomyces sp. NPDC048411]|uniref:IS701 family transposase n=1 Tax=Streptomyces sp. NPDC048411 TaxID=3157206 RepID=UPI0034558216
MKAELLEVPFEVSDREWVEEWAGRLDDLLVGVGRFFGRVETQWRGEACIRGLLGPASRKNGWQLAEYAGDRAPWNQQHLLDRARWDVDGVRDFTRRYAVAQLADDGVGAGPGGAGVLVVDETGFAKRGKASAGVARQYSGALGGVFPCQVGVMAAWATGAGQTLIDRELYLPKEWTDAPERCRAAHVPPERGFLTKPRLAEAMIARALPDLPGGAGAVWVAADEVYGREQAFRSFLEERRLPYVVNIQANTPVMARPGWRHAARLVERVAREEDWVELAAGPSQLDTRSWQWWVRRLPGPGDLADGEVWARWFIARRRSGEPGKRDYYLGWGPADTPVEEIVLVPGARWRVEEAIKLAKSACGLADYEVRSFHGWYRHITLAQLAAAFLAGCDAATARESGPPASTRFGQPPSAAAASSGQRGGRS